MPIITNDDGRQFTFDEYEKVGTTKLSREVLSVGQIVKTLEGEYTCAEPSRLAIDANGNVYPIANSIFEKSYRSATDQAAKDHEAMDWLRKNPRDMIYWTFAEGVRWLATGGVYHDDPADAILAVRDCQQRKDGGK